MIITTNAGHTPTSPGTSGLLDEVALNRPMRDHVNAELRARGHEVYDCTAPDWMAYPDELDRQCYLANAGDAELALSFHFNAGGGTGPEVCYWDGDERGRSIAAKISANLARAMGLRDRGAKPRGRELGFLRDTGMTALIVETCFVDRQEDADAWHRTPWDHLACAVADGVDGKDWQPPAPAPEPEPEPTPDPDGDGCGTHHVVRPGDIIEIAK